MGRTGVLAVIFCLVISGHTFAQYYISSNEKLFLANASKTETPESALTTAHNFFNLGQIGQRAAWEELLAGTCFKDNKPCDYVNSWFDELSNGKTKFTILKTSSPKTNQKIIHFVSEQSPDENKAMVLVKEKSRWKIYHAGL